jgi:hypothetical protein
LIELVDRKIVEHDVEAGVILTNKVGINFAVFDVRGDEVVADSGVWYPYHGAKDRAESKARSEYKRRCDAVRRFL